MKKVNKSEKKSDILVQNGQNHANELHVIFPEKELEIFILIKVLHITKRKIPTLKEFFIYIVKKKTIQIEIKL